MIDTLECLIRDAAEVRLLAGLATDLAAAPEHDQEDLAAWDAVLADGQDPDENLSAWR